MLSSQLSKSDNTPSSLSYIDDLQFNQGGLHVFKVPCWILPGRVVSNPPFEAHLTGWRRQKQFEKPLLGCETQHQMSEGSARQQLRGGLRDMYKIGSAIFWKMCCWFDTFQVEALFLRMSIIVDEDKLQVLPSKEKERIGDENCSQGRSVSSS